MDEFDAHVASVLSAREGRTSGKTFFAVQDLIAPALALKRCTFEVYDKEGLKACSGFLMPVEPPAAPHEHLLVPFGQLPGTP